MHPLMSARGHRLITPTFTGLGERGHLTRPDVDLDTHIADILGVLEFEDLTNVSLIGHSYGGMVATGVADRARARIAQLIYLDAFVPDDGDGVYDLLPAETRAQRQAAGTDGRIAPGPAARYASGGPRLVRTAPATTAGENFRAETENAKWRAHVAAPPHLLHALPTRRPLPAVL
jgi:pimeloyl-ACP methyl ester carboxylesterase